MGLIITLSHNASAADKIKKLNEDNITKFVEYTSALTNRKNKNISDKEVEKYLERHLHKQGRFISKITYIVPGFAPQDSAISLGKKEFIDTTLQGSEAVEDYDNTIEILSIDISSDKRKATVFTTGTEQGIMEVDAGQAVPIMGKSNCTQILMLSKKDILQMFNARCETQIEFSGF